MVGQNTPRLRVDSSNTATLTNKTIDPASNTISLANTHLLVGSSGGAAADVAMSGDATMANTGALSIANSAVTLAKSTGLLGVPDYGNFYMDLVDGSAPTGSALTTMSATPDAYTGLIGVTIAGGNLLNFTVTVGDASSAVGRLTYTGATTKKFLVVWTAGATMSDTAVFYGFSLLLNGTRTAASGKAVMKGSANPETCGCSAIVQLAQNDYLQLAASTSSSGSPTVRMLAGSITALPITNT